MKFAVPPVARPASGSVRRNPDNPKYASVSVDKAAAPKETEPFTPATYRRLLDDPDVPLGAFKLWHMLHDYLGKKGLICPGIGTLAERMGSKREHVMAWRNDLVGAGYLQVSIGSSHQSTRYMLRGGTKLRSLKRERKLRSPKRDCFGPQKGTASVPKKGIEGNPFKGTHLREGLPPARSTGANRALRPEKEIITWT